MTKITRFALSSGAALALLAGASTLPAASAPLGANFESLKNAAPAATETVQWRRHHHRHRGVAIGLGAFGAGLIAGAAIANSPGYYDAPYGYYEAPYGYYNQPYGYYYGPSGNGNQYNGYDDLSDVAR